MKLSGRSLRNNLTSAALASDVGERYGHDSGIEPPLQSHVTRAISAKPERLHRLLTPGRKMEQLAAAQVKKSL